jgi:hypothetical protein
MPRVVFEINFFMQLWTTRRKPYQGKKREQQFGVMERLETDAGIAPRPRLNF